MEQFHFKILVLEIVLFNKTALACKIQIYCGKITMSWRDLITAAIIQYRAVTGSTYFHERLLYGFTSAFTIFHMRFFNERGDTAV